MWNPILKSVCGGRSKTYELTLGRGKLLLLTAVRLNENSLLGSKTEF